MGALWNFLFAVLQNFDINTQTSDKSFFFFLGYIVRVTLLLCSIRQPTSNPIVPLRGLSILYASVPSIIGADSPKDRIEQGSETTNSTHILSSSDDITKYNSLTSKPTAGSEVPHNDYEISPSFHPGRYRASRRSHISSLVPLRLVAFKRDWG